MLLNVTYTWYDLLSISNINILKTNKLLKNYIFILHFSLEMLGLTYEVQKFWGVLNQQAKMSTVEHHLGMIFFSSSPRGLMWNSKWAH